MPADRALRWAALALLVVHAAYGLLPALTTIRNDFANYYVSARLVRAGRPLERAYERIWFQNEIRRAGLDRLGSFTSYPPANALLLRPLAGLAPRVAKAIWTVLLALCLIAGFLVLRRVLALSGSWLALAFLVQSSALANTLVFGQPYPLLLLLLCLALRCLCEGRGLRAGLLLSPIVALKLYGLPFLAYFLWTRRFAAAAGLAFGTGLITLGSIAALGLPAHAAYARDALPLLLRGELLDPYATAWQSLPSLAHRLFQFEPDLNPIPVSDWPSLCRGLSRGLPATLLLLAILAGAPGARPDRTLRECAGLVVAALAASPVIATYHLVLLAPASAVLLAQTTGSRSRLAVLAMLAFAASPLPFAFGRFADGWGNLAAVPRLWALLILVYSLLRPLLSARIVAWSLGGGVAVGLLAGVAPSEQAWTRVTQAKAERPLMEPAACAGELSFVTFADERLVVRTTGGRTLSGPGDTFSPRCVDGRLVVLRSVGPGAPGQPAEAADRDRASDGSLEVWLDRARGALVERGADGKRRTLARGVLGHPRLSPDGAWVLYQAWQPATFSWDLRAVERASGREVSVTSDPANELEGSWLPDGRTIVFASDRRRGLASAALYSVSFAP